MKKALGCTALSCALGLVDSKVLRWSDDGSRWTPAQETLGFMPSLGMGPPTPTPPPEATKTREALRARDTKQNTCAYVSGSAGNLLPLRVHNQRSTNRFSDYPLTCAPTASCIINTTNSHVGCCDDTTVCSKVMTTCYDSTDASLYTTNNGYTVWWYVPVNLT